MKSYPGFIEGRGAQWEAFCFDFDIAVCGRSLEEVRVSLSEAVSAYVQEAKKEAPETREKLLKRRAPWHLKFRWALRGVLSNRYVSPAQADYGYIGQEHESEGKEKTVWRRNIHAYAYNRRPGQHAEGIEHDKSCVGAGKFRPVVARAEMGEAHGVKRSDDSAPQRKERGKG